MTNPDIVVATTAAPTDDRRKGAVTVWALAGAVWLIISAQAYVRWMLSDSQFAPAPVLGPDELEPWRLVGIRVLEVASTAVLAGFLWFCVVKPWRASGKLSLDGKFVLGGLVAFAADVVLNLRAYVFAWNAHSVNLGSWSPFMPLHDPAVSGRYAEALLWGPPMYVYFCAGVAIVACVYANKLRARFPAMSNVTLFGLVWLGEFFFDLVVEVVIMRATHAYAYVRTFRVLTLWPGQIHQFPLTEAIFVATLGCLYTWMRMAAQEHPDGLSPVERGFERWPARWQGPIRTLAVIGFCSVATILIYHLPTNWVGLTGDSVVDLPSYMRAG
ncbi:spirocyclase AveC family protein [Nocardia sp. NPDC059239]|uniref:spirocyclase AveC family protein n=1 Tax=unclassified Nocardia TaxID=2637762 RepID=UPI003686AD45